MLCLEIESIDSVSLKCISLHDEVFFSIMQRLTGGVLLLRNKFYIILFRGKDFLPTGVATSVAERELKLKKWQLCEEDARQKASESIPLADEPSLTSSKTGTLSDFHEIQTEHRNLDMGNKGANLQVEAERERLRKELRKQERRLFIVCLTIVLHSMLSLFVITFVHILAAQ